MNACRIGSGGVCCLSMGWPWCHSSMLYGLHFGMTGGHVSCSHGSLGVHGDGIGRGRRGPCWGFMYWPNHQCARVGQSYGPITPERGVCGYATLKN